MNWILAIVFSLSFFTTASAKEIQPLLFGPEFTFEVPVNLDEGEAMLRLSKAMKVHLIVNQPEAAQFTVINNHTFKSPNGWAIRLTRDIGVIEAKMDPMTASDFEKYADDIQDALFETAYKLGYYPALFAGGGHLNHSAQYFLDKPLLFRNHIVDLFNHSELSLGVLNYDTNNALPSAFFGAKEWKKIKTAIHNFDKSKSANKPRLAEFSADLNRALHMIYDSFNVFWHRKLGQRGKNSWLCFTHINGFHEHDSRVEIRSVRAQWNIYVFVRQIRLIEARLEYLSGLDGKLELKPNYLKTEVDNYPYPAAKDLALNPPVDPQWALDEFYKYVTEAGENWSDHQDYLWPRWISDGEVEKFNERLKGCNSHFELSI